MNEKLFAPIYKLFDDAKNPYSIKDIAKSLNLPYSIAKQRLHKLEKIKKINRMKRGYYCNPSLIFKYNQTSSPSGAIYFINASARIMSGSNGIWITIYNSGFGEKVNNQYCTITYLKDNRFVIRPSNRFVGNKLYLLKCRSLALPISRKRLPDQILSKLSNKCSVIKIGIYLNDWGISVKDLFSTESKEEGELAEELEKLGSIEKKDKFNNLKADILFIKKNKKIPIEITNTNPFSKGKLKNSRRSGVKSSLIFERLYFFIKWNILYGSPTCLILNENWKNLSWLEKELNFVKNYKCNILFTDFEKGWAKPIAQEINRLIE